MYNQIIPHLNGNEKHTHTRAYRSKERKNPKQFCCCVILFSFFLFHIRKFHITIVFTIAPAGVLFFALIHTHTHARFENKENLKFFPHSCVYESCIISNDSTENEKQRAHTSQQPKPEQSSASHYGFCD